MLLTEDNVEAFERVDDISDILSNYAFSIVRIFNNYKSFNKKNLFFKDLNKFLYKI